MGVHEIGNSPSVRPTDDQQPDADDWLLKFVYFLNFLLNSRRKNLEEVDEKNKKILKRNYMGKQWNYPSTKIEKETRTTPTITKEETRQRSIKIATL